MIFPHSIILKKPKHQKGITIYQSSLTSLHCLKVLLYIGFPWYEPKNVKLVCWKFYHSSLSGKSQSIRGKSLTVYHYHQQQWVKREDSARWFLFFFFLLKTETQHYRWSPPDHFSVCSIDQQLLNFVMFIFVIHKLLCSSSSHHDFEVVHWEAKNK